jgi:hypothetical protein
MSILVTAAWAAPMATRRAVRVLEARMRLSFGESQEEMNAMRRVLERDLGAILRVLEERLPRS